MIFEQLRKRTSSFRARSADRDANTDRAIVGSVGKAIDDALTALTAERDGLNRRFQDAQARASIAAGTEYDEYLTRDEEQAHNLSMLETEMQNASSRLATLEQHLTDLKFLRAVYQTRFPKF